MAYQKLEVKSTVNVKRLDLVNTSELLYNATIAVRGKEMQFEGSTRTEISDAVFKALDTSLIVATHDADFWTHELSRTMDRLEDDLHITFVRVDDHQPDEEPIITNMAEAKSDLRDLWCDDEGVDREWFESIDSMTFEELNDAWGGVGYSLEPLEEWLSRQPREKQWETLLNNG